MCIYLSKGTDFMNAMDDVMICYVLQRTRRPLFNSISVYISGAILPSWFWILYYVVGCFHISWIEFFLVYLHASQALTHLYTRTC